MGRSQDVLYKIHVFFKERKKLKTSLDIDDKVKLANSEN